MKVLLATTALPTRQRCGGEIVSQQVVEALRALGHDVQVLGYVRVGESASPGERCVGARPIETSEAGWRGPAWAARALATGRPYSSAKYRSRSYTRAVAEALYEYCDLLVVDHAQVHFALERSRRVPPVIHVAHNAESLLYRDLAARAGGPHRALYARESRLLGEIESRLAGIADEVWTLTDADADYFRGLGADARTLSIASPLGLAPDLAPEYDIAMIGNWTWEANAAGLRWFLAEVVPHLDPALTVAVAGLASQEIAAGARGVTALGTVPDVTRFLARARVVAVPAVSGAGLQIKTLDAIACGLPVVVTPFALRGLTDLPASVAVADDGIDFAAALERAAARTDRAGMRTAAAAWSERRRRQLVDGVRNGLAKVAGAGLHVSADRVAAAPLR